MATAQLFRSDTGRWDPWACWLGHSWAPCIPCVVATRRANRLFKTTHFKNFDARQIVTSDDTNILRYASNEVKKTMINRSSADGNHLI
jgi:hypothetical protein